MAQFDNVQIDLTLNYDDFMKKIDDANKRFDALFSTADKNASNLSKSFVDIVSKMQSFDGKSTSAIGRMISQFKQLDGTTDAVKKSVDELFKKFKENGNKLSIADGSDAISSMDTLITREVQYTPEQMKTAYKSVQDALADYNAEYDRHLKLVDAAEQEFKDKLNPLTTELEKAQRAYNLEEEKGIKFTEALQIAENNRVVVLAQLQKRLEEQAKAENALNKYKEKYDIETTKSGTVTAVGGVDVLGVDESELDSKIQKILTKYNELLQARDEAAEHVGSVSNSYEKAKKAVDNYSAAVKSQTLNTEKAAEKVQSVEKKIADTTEKKAKEAADAVAKEAKEAADSAEKEAKRTEKSVIESMSSMANRIASIIATVGITKMFNKSVEAASVAEKSVRRLEAVYGSVAASARVASKEISDMYGMSDASAASQLGYVGNLLTSYGLAKDQALELSKSIVGLGADLASFSGGTKDTVEAVDSLTQALLGNYRATRDMGISITESEVKSFAKQLGLATDSLTQSELALLRYKVIVDQAKNAIGDFNRNQDSYYNATQQFKAAIEDLKVSFGEDLLPVITEFLHIFTDAVTKLSDLPGAAKAATVGFITMAAAFSLVHTTVKPLLTSMMAMSATLGNTNGKLSIYTIKAGLAAKATKGLSAETIKFNAALKAGAIGQIAAILTGVIAAIGYVIAETKRAKEEARDFSGSVAELQTVVSNYNNVLNQHREGLTGVDAAMQEYNEYAAKNITEASMQATLSAWRASGTYLDQLKVKSKEAEDELVTLTEEFKKCKSTIDATGDSSDPMDLENALTVGSNEKLYEKTLPTALKKYRDAQSACTDEVVKYTNATKQLAELVFNNPDLYNLLDTSDKARLQEYIDKLEVGVDLGLDLDKILKASAYDAENWANKLKQAQTSLDNYNKKLEETNGEYRKVTNYSLNALEKENKAYEDNIRDALEYQRILYANSAKDAGKSADEIRADLDNITAITEAAIKSKVSEDDLKNSLAAYNSADFSVIKYASIVKDMVDKDEWYQKSREALELEYSNNILKYRQQIATKLEALQNRETKTLEGRNQKDINKLQTAYRDALSTIYSAYGGAEGLATDSNGVFNRAMANTIEAMRKALDEGTGTLTRGTDENGLIYYMVGDLKAEGQQLQNFFGDLDKANEALQEGITNTNRYYATERETILSEQKNSLLNTQKEITSNIEKQYAIEKQLLDDELAYDLKHSEENNESKFYILKEYAAKEVALERNKNEALREYREELANNTRSITKSMTDRWFSTSSDSTGFLTSTVKSLLDVKNDYEEISSSLNSTIAKARKNILSYFDTDELSDGETEALNKVIAAVDAGNFSLAESLIANIQDTFPKVGDKLKSELSAALDASNKLAAQKAKAIGDTIASALTTALNSLNTLFTQFEDNQLTGLKNQLAEMKDAQSALQKAMEASNKETNENMTVAQKDALKRQEAMDEEELARLEAQIAEQEEIIEDEERKQWERQKAFSIAAAIITGLQSTLDAYAGGMAMAPYLGPAAMSAPAIAATLAAVAAAFSAAQVAAIASQPYPSYAVGAYDLPQDQTAQVHKGEMIVPKPFAEEIRNNGGFGSGEVVVNVYGATDEVSVEENSSDSTQQIDVYLTKRVKQMVANGELDNSLQSRYAISRNGRKG